MMIPRTLEEWDYNVIRQLVIEGYCETDTFDFKPALKYTVPCQRERDKYNEKLLNTVCAFANTYGGFIVFGIEDAKNKAGENRIVGLDQRDFGAEFGEKIKDLDPILSYIITLIILLPISNYAT